MKILLQGDYELSTRVVEDVLERRLSDDGSIQWDVGPSRFQNSDNPNDH